MQEINCKSLPSIFQPSKSQIALYSPCRSVGRLVGVTIIFLILSQIRTEKRSEFKQETCTVYLVQFYEFLALKIQFQVAKIYSSAGPFLHEIGWPTIFFSCTGGVFFERYKKRPLNPPSSFSKTVIIYRDLRTPKKIFTRPNSPHIASPPPSLICIISGLQ